MQATPPGANRLTEGFAAIEAEIGKIGSPNNLEVDWSVVARESEPYLQKVAKDLRVATYLALAWGETKGGTGLRRGFDLLVGLLGEPWEGLVPPVDRMKARSGALSWLSERLETRLAPIVDARKLEFDDGMALVLSFIRYQEAVAKRFPKGGPSLGPAEQAFAAVQKQSKLPPNPEKKKEKAAVTSDDPILQPIAGDSPVGSDPKLTDEFDQIYVEIQKIGAVDGGDVDWKLMRDATATILATKGKDLRCLCYWIWARFSIDGVKGLREGAANLAAFSKSFGGDMHPKRPKARSAALNWLGVRMEEEFPKALKSIPEADQTAIKTSFDEAQTALEPIVKTIDGIRNCRKGLLSVRAEKPKPKPKPKPAAAAKPAGGARPAAKPAGPPPEAAAVVPPELEDISAQMLATAQEMAAGGDNASSLRMRRQALWLAAPALIKGKKYDCEIPAARERMEIEGHFKSKRWEELLERTEEMFLGYPYCLDLTFWAAKAARELVGEDAEKALIGELVALVLRTPKLMRATDRSGQALASKDARAFINEHRGSGGGTPATAPAAAAPAAGAAGAGAAPVAAAPAVAPAQLPAEIEQLFKDGKVNEAVTKASAAAAGLTGRAAFQRNLLLAERLVDAKSNALAFSLFRALLGQLRATALPQWEPKMGARCIRGYLRCAKATRAKLENDGELLDELMLLDPSAAIGLV